MFVNTPMKQAQNEAEYSSMYNVYRGFKEQGYTN